MKEFIKQSLYLLDGEAKKSIPFLVIAFILSSLLDMLGIGLIGVFLGLLASPHYIVQKFPQAAINASQLSDKRWIIVAGLLIIAAFVFKALTALIIQKKVVTFGQSFSVRLKSRMMQAYQFVPYTYHLKRNSAYLLSRIQENTNNYINLVLMPTFTIMSNAIVGVAILVLLLMMNPLSTALLIVLFTTVGLGYDALTKRKQKTMGKIAAVTNGEIVKSVRHGLSGLSEIRVLGREAYFLAKVNQFSNQFAHAYGVSVAMQQVPRYLIENAMAVFIVALCMGGIATGANVGKVLAMVGIFAAAGARLLPTVTQMMTALNQIRGNQHHMVLVYQELVELDALIASAVNNYQQLDCGHKLPFLKMELKDVGYQYSDAESAVIENVNLSITKGQSIGLIGPSGAGKSTLVNLILGFLIPQKGQLLIDGMIVQNYRAWLNNFAYIPQSIFLLDDTLRRNIALGVEDEAIDEDRMQEAVTMAQLKDVVRSLPCGLDTFVGENGVRLSGGQRQRVALARAFYHERDIVVMDEATSSLDNETENEVINTIKQLKGNKTLIVIAHRLSTVEHCDILYKLDQGKITAVGSFQEVVGSDAAFSRQGVN